MKRKISLLIGIAISAFAVIPFKQTLHQIGPIKLLESLKIEISQSVLDNLKNRFNQIRWMEEVKDSEWNFSTNPNYLYELSGRWLFPFHPNQSHRLSEMSAKTPCGQ